MFGFGAFVPRSPLLNYLPWDSQAQNQYVHKVVVPVRGVRFLTALERSLQPSIKNRYGIDWSGSCGAVEHGSRATLSHLSFAMRETTAYPTWATCF